MIAIFGGGIAGLTTALELVNKGFKIKIYEKDDSCGGMAKSKRINGIPTEHSWRGYARFYNNIFDILQQIPVLESFTDNIYTMNEFKVNIANGKKWTIYKNNIYDISDFISKHPGGLVIHKAIGNDVEQVWKDNNASWHKLFVNFDKMDSIIKIGTIKTVESFNNTALDNLSNPFNMNIYNNKPTNKSFFDLLKDSPPLLYHFLKFSTSNKRSEEYYNKYIMDSFKNTSKYTYDLIIGQLGPGLGLDKNSCSLGLLFHYKNLDLGAKDLGYNPTWSVFKKPTSEGFIDPLVDLLKSKGVEFIYNVELKSINHVNNKIINCTVAIGASNKIITADEYIIAINPNNCYELFNKSNMTNLAKQHLELSIINNQISFRLGFKNKINFKNNKTGLVMVDSPYNITFYGQDHFFNVPIDTNNNLKSLWSGTCIQTYTYGYNKPATSLNKQELIDEIIEQILRCEELQNEIKEINGKMITKEDIIYSDIWYEWQWNGTNLESTNKKWVNTVQNEKYKPNQLTEFNNLYLAGGHTKTSLKIWSMESACESGKLVANHILTKYNKEKCKIVLHDKPLYFKIFEPFDDLLYILKLPALIDIFLLFILIYIIYISLKHIK